MQFLIFVRWSVKLQNAAGQYSYNVKYKSVISFHKILTFSFLISINYLLAAQNQTDFYKFKTVMNAVETMYVDSADISKLTEVAIKAMLKELDPHSVYIDRDRAQSVNNNIRGNFEGVGIQFDILQDTLIVVMPISGGPSEKVGIRAGDRIVAVNDSNIAGIGITNDRVRELLMGPKDTKVNISIKRLGNKEIQRFVITRDKIPLYSIDAAYLIDKNIAYIKLNRFSATTMSEYAEKMDELVAAGAESLILDLRDNGGGLLNASVQLSDQFLQHDELIVYTEGINYPRIDYDATARGNFEKGNLVVLVNESSASASEILSGAIQDWDRGVLIGRRTFGKGLVQRPINLIDGSLLRITIARYYTPSGRLIQKNYKNGDKAYKEDLKQRFQHGEMLFRDSIFVIDSLEFNTLKNSRKVYGGGGVIPDIFVPMDTTFFSDLHSELIRKGKLFDFVNTYIDQNREELYAKYPDFAVYNQNFIINSQIVEQLKAYSMPAFKQTIENDSIGQLWQEAEQNQNLKLHLKALIAGNIWSVNYYHQLMNTSDACLREAIEILHDTKRYKKILKGKL